MKSEAASDFWRHLKIKISMGNASGITLRNDDSQCNNSIPRTLSCSNLECIPVQRQFSSTSSQGSTVIQYKERKRQGRTLNQIHNSLRLYKTKLRHAYGDSYDEIYRSHIYQADIGILYVKEDVEIQRSLTRSLREFDANIRIICPRPGHSIYREWERMFRICSTIVIVFSRNFSNDRGMRNMRANILMFIKHLFIYQCDQFEKDDHYWRPHLDDCAYHRSHLTLHDWSQTLVRKMDSSDLFQARYEREEEKAKQQLRLIREEETHQNCGSQTPTTPTKPWPITASSSSSSLVETPVRSLAMNCFNLVLGLHDTSKESIE